MAESLLVLGLLIVAGLLAAVAAYNGLAGLRRDVRAAWAAMDEQLRRRYDHLPAVASAVRTAAPTDDRIAAAAAAAAAAKNAAAVAFNPDQLAAAEAALSVALADLFSLATARPALTADPAFQRARADLLASDRDITRARLAYNDAVGAYNAAAASFPCDLVAAALGLKPQPTFDLPA